MNNNNSKGVSYKTGFFLLVGLTILGFVLSSVIGILILSKATGASLLDMQKAVDNPANAGILRWIQLESVVLSMFLPAVVTAAILSRRPFGLLGYETRPAGKSAVIILGIMIVSIFVAGALGYLNKVLLDLTSVKHMAGTLETSYAKQVQMMLDFSSFGGYLSSLFIMALLPAICEETLFRGGLQNFLQRATGKPWLAIIVVSIIFSIVHFSFYGFLPRLFLGIILGLIFNYTGSIWLSMLAHFLNNALAVTQAYAMTRQGKSIDEALNENVPYWYIGFLALPILFLLLRALKKTRQTNPEAYGLNL